MKTNCLFTVLAHMISVFVNTLADLNSADVAFVIGVGVGAALGELDSANIAKMVEVTVGAI